MFKGYEWNRISRSDRLLLGTLFLNYVHTTGFLYSSRAVEAPYGFTGRRGRSFVNAYHGEIMEMSDGTSEVCDLPDSFSARLKISGKCLLDLVMNFPYIFEVSESEEINIPLGVGNHVQ